MFKNDRNRRSKAKKIAEWLSDHGHFKSHGRHIQRQELEKRGIRVKYLEEDQKTQDLFLSVFHATTHTFNGTNAVKIIENHLGKAFIKQVQPMIVQIPGPQGGTKQPSNVPLLGLPPVQTGQVALENHGKIHKRGGKRRKE
jgi:hypothetical protein